jgi:hypothetical protein
MIEKRFLKSQKFFFLIKKIIDIDILNDSKTKNCFKESNNDNNDKKSDNEKTAENNTSDVKFANMTNLKSFKYASMFVNKTFNNLF